MHCKSLGVTILLVLSFSSFASAGPVADAAARAEALQAEGKIVEALDALAEAVDAIWTGGPLGFRTVAVVDSASGFGVYQERSDPTYRPDEKLTVYVEPVGFGYGSAEGAASIGFTADLAIENATGEVLSDTKDVFSLSAPSGAGKREFYMALTFVVPYLRPGAYRAVFTVHDQNSDKSGSFGVAFGIALPVAQ
ncbi:MAG: hypothetical protein ACRED5_02635 [Propylenella sp.]